MTSHIKLFHAALLSSLLLIAASSAKTAYGSEKEPEAEKLVRGAIDYLRDNSSYAEAQMTIHRRDWERKMSFRAWSKGTDHTLVRFVYPAKDAGSASLTAGEEMWMFSPKINKIVRIPPSMRSQSWMGSDFSYRDLAKTDDIVRYYRHRILSTERIDGVKVYQVESIPLESAPVVWGKEVMKIREDYIPLEHCFYDQEMKLVKTWESLDIKMLGNKLYPRILRVEQAEDPDAWTEVIHEVVKFQVDLPDWVFTLSNLSAPREINLQ